LYPSQNLLSFLFLSMCICYAIYSHVVKHSYTHSLPFSSCVDRWHVHLHQCRGLGDRRGVGLQRHVVRPLPHPPGHTGVHADESHRWCARRTLDACDMCYAQCLRVWERHGLETVYVLLLYIRLTHRIVIECAK